MRGRRTTTVAIAFAFAAAVVLSGCTPGDPEGEPPAAPDTGRPSPAAPQPPTAVPHPTLKPDLSAAENLPVFDFTNLGVVAADPAALGRAFIDALTQAGFDRAAMELTSDVTTLDEPADSVQFSVRFQGECLVGQYGPKSGGYHGAVRPMLGTGRCLVGQSVPVD